MDPDGRVRWLSLRRDQETVHRAEPEVGFGAACSLSVEGHCQE
jgi:hypothetical protein